MTTILTATELSALVNELLPVATIADLRELAPPDNQAGILVQGYYSAGDGGGGDFYWDAASTASDNGGTVILPTGHSGAGRWRRIYSGALNVKWFGAKGDNLNNDAAAIQAAIDLLPSAGGDIEMPTPAVAYGITATLTVAHKSRVRFSGSSPSGDTHGCPIKWNGSSGGTALLLNRVRDSLFQDFSIEAGTGTLAIGIRVDHATAGVGGSLSTNNSFKRIAVGAATTAGFQIGNSSTANNDYHKFEDCYATGAGANGLYIHDNQSKWNRVAGCIFGDKTNGINVNAGSFHSFGCGFNDNTIDVLLGAVTDNINITSAQSENSEKFLDDGGANNTAWCVTVQNSRLDPNAVGADNIFMRFRKGGPLALINNEFGNGVYRGSVRFSFSAASPGCTVLSLGNNYPNETPFSAGTSNRISLNDKGLDSGSLPVDLPSHFNTSAGIAIRDGVTEPATESGLARIYVDVADGDLKVKYGDGTVKTIVVDT
jgi:hypothetical protein